MTPEYVINSVGKIVTGMASKVQTAKLDSEFRYKLKSKIQAAVALCKQNPLGAASLLIIFVLGFMAVFAPSLVSHDPDTMNVSKLLSPPSFDYPMGTDHFGRDMWSRIVYGSRVSLIVAFFSSIVGTAVGGIIGIISGYIGGKTDSIIQRIMDVLMSFPAIVLALAIVAAIGASLANVIFAIVITMIPRASRVARSSALSVKETDYVYAAKLIGCSEWRIIWLYVLPNCMAPILIIATAQLGNAIIVEASLSYLGLGVPPPTPTWGGMLSAGAAGYFELAPWTAIFPGLVLAVTVLAFSFFGDSLRDTWDPKLRRR